MAATVAQWFTMIEQSFVALADAMPAEKYAFKPMNGEFKDSRTLAQQVKHVACSNFGFFNEIEKKAPPEGCGTGGPNPATTKRDHDLFARVVHVCRPRAANDDAGNALEPAGGPLRRREHALRTHDARRLTPPITTVSSSCTFA